MLPLRLKSLPGRVTTFWKRCPSTTSGRYDGVCLAFPNNCYSQQMALHVGCVSCHGTLIVCVVLEQVRKTIIQMVLATDNELHFELLAKLTAAQNAVNAAASNAASDDTSATPMRVVSTAKGQLMVLQVALHAADVSNVRLFTSFL